VKVFVFRKNQRIHHEGTKDTKKNNRFNSIYWKLRALRAFVVKNVFSLIWIILSQSLRLGNRKTIIAKFEYGFPSCLILIVPADNALHRLRYVALE